MSPEYCSSVCEAEVNFITVQTSISDVEHDEVEEDFSAYKVYTGKMYDKLYQAALALQ